jgi:tetratricopeptide (TPR) repeat protein
MRIERDHASWEIHLQAETNYAHRYTEVSLEKLSNSESDRLVDGLLGVSDLPESVRHFVMERSEGNPLYAEEVVQHLVERGYLVKEDNTWQATMDFGEIGIPDTLQGLLLARIDQQEEDVRRTLQLASVIGRSFMYRLLEAISEAERELDNHLAQLQRADLVRENARLPELEYIFKHSLTQEAAYNSLLLERRKEFHRKVGETIERLFDEHAEELTGLLAHHWERAGHPDKAVQYLLRAGERARRLHAHLEALGYYNRAVGLMDDDSDSFLPTLNHRAHVLLELFRGKDAVADFETLQAIALKNNDRPSEVMTLLGLGRGNYILALDETDIDFAIRSKKFYESSYELAKEIGDKAGMIRALVPTTWFSDFWPENADQASENMKEAFKLSQELGDEDLILESKLAMTNTGTLYQREHLGEELRVELEARHDLPRLNILLFRLMFTHLGLGNFEKCVETCESGIEVAKTIGVPPVQYATIQALAYIRLGRFDDARRSLEEEVADEAHRFGKAFRDTGYGIYYLEILAYEKARETLESSIKQADLVGRAWLVNFGRFHLVRALEEGGVGSNSEIESILNYFDPSKFINALIFGKFAYSSGDYVQALEMANNLENYAKENGRHPELASALLLKAQSSLATEQFNEAVSAAEEGIELAMELEYLPILWRLRGTRAETLKRLGQEKESAEEFKRASEIIEELAGNISEEDLRNTFLSNPIVTSILAAAKTKSEEKI